MNNGTCCKWSCRRAPTRRSRGRPPADLRRICNALLYLVRAGCAWRLLPRDFGPWKTVYHYFRLWSRQGFGRPFMTCFGAWCETRPANAASPPPPSWTRRPFVRPTKRASEAMMQPRKPKASNVCPGGHVGVALGRLCHQSRRARTSGSPPLAGFRAGLLPVVALSVGRPRLRRRGVGRMGRGAAQDGHLAAGGRAAPPRSTWLQSVAQTLDRRTDLRLVYEHRRLVRHYEVKPVHAESWLHISMIGLMLRRLA